MNAENDQPNIPEHLGLILDGHRRWARQQGIPQLEGHRRGYEHLKTIGLAALDRGIKTVSAFVFSTENWNRSEEEVGYLINLMHWVAQHEIEEIHRRNVKVKWLGSREKLTSKEINLIEKSEAKTKNNTAGTFALCFNYGGQQEIVEAAKSLVEAGVTADEITPEKFSQYLYAPEVPQVDLMIRTSGEHRTSGFMLWRAAYAELLFVDKYWPDFTEADLDAALAEYASRSRRFGR